MAGVRLYLANLKKFVRTRGGENQRIPTTRILGEVLKGQKTLGLCAIPEECNKGRVGTLGGFLINWLNLWRRDADAISAGSNSRE
jgi:hypothetical protein